MYALALNLALTPEGVEAVITQRYAHAKAGEIVEGVMDSAKNAAPRLFVGNLLAEDQFGRPVGVWNGVADQATLAGQEATCCERV